MIHSLNFTILRDWPKHKVGSEHFLKGHQYREGGSVCGKEGSVLGHRDVCRSEEGKKGKDFSRLPDT